MITKEEFNLLYMPVEEEIKLMRDYDYLKTPIAKTRDSVGTSSKRASGVSPGPAWIETLAADGETICYKKKAGTQSSGVRSLFSRGN
ncbi:MAG: hypothetical protein AABY06_02160 [Nanoarchaeota archaeon]